MRASRETRARRGVLRLIGRLAPAQNEREFKGLGENHAGQDRARRTFRHSGNGRGFDGLFSASRCGSEVQGAQCGHPWPAARADGRARHRDDAAVAQRAGGAGDSRHGARRRNRAQGQRLSRRTGAEAAGPISGLCRARHAGSGRRGARTRALRQGARLPRRAGQRLFASRRRRHRALLRPAAIPAVLGDGRTARRAVLSASAQSAAARCADL